TSCSRTQSTTSASVCIHIHRLLAGYTQFSCNDATATEIYTLSLHDALPICRHASASPSTFLYRSSTPTKSARGLEGSGFGGVLEDRKSTRLNSSHVAISYAVFCLKKNNFTANLSRKNSPLNSRLIVR